MSNLAVGTQPVSRVFDGYLRGTMIEAHGHLAWVIAETENAETTMEYQLIYGMQYFSLEGVARRVLQQRRSWEYVGSPQAETVAMLLPDRRVVLSEKCVAPSALEMCARLNDYEASIVPHKNFRLMEEHGVEHAVKAALMGLI